MENKKKKKEKYIIGTHNGIFHSDELVACGIMTILLRDLKEVIIIRSRDINMLKKECDILIDIGSGRFDHHQKNGNGKRTNNIAYASAGLIWKEFGELLIDKLSNNCLSKKENIKIFDKIDNEIIEKIDKEDNGETLDQSPFYFINYFLPSWEEKNPNYDNAFTNALHCVTEILDKYFKHTITTELASKEINKRLYDTQTRYDNILLLPSQTINWTDIIIDYNLLNPEKPVDFVIFPYPAGGYALQCVPPSKENKFAQRIKLPDSWGGETTNLPEITGIKSAVFCHKGCFFARTLNLKDAINMCINATKSNNKILLKHQ